MKTIALTGIMGAGKSSVIELLGQMQIMVLDCDAINASLLQKDARGYRALRKKFGDGILNTKQEIDAKKMSALIFSDPEKKAIAEGILHPMIKEEILRTISMHPKEDIIVVEVPLLFEVHWETAFDEIWVVTCDTKILLQRLRSFRHIDEAEAKRRIAYQMPQEEKCARADVVLHNDKDKSYLKEQILQEIQRIREENKDVKK